MSIFERESDMSGVKVSVIIPVYNSSRFIDECITSLIQQKEPALEFIFVDDESTDNSVQIIESYKKSDPRIRILHQPYGNAGTARNTGLQQACGDYIHFMDSDDWIPFDLYSGWYDFACKTKSQVSVGLYYTRHMVSGKINKCGKAAEKNALLVSNMKTNPRLFLAESAVAPWNKLYNREFLLKHRLKYDDFICCNDRGFYYEMLLYAERISHYPHVVMNYRIGNSDSLIGVTRLNNFDCHFKSFDRIWRLYEDQSEEIKQILINITMLDLEYFYNRASGDFEKSIRAQLRDYLPTIDLSCFGTLLGKQPWCAFYCKMCAPSDDYLFILKSMIDSLSAQAAQAAKACAALNSKSYRIGCAITFLPRKAWGFIRCLREHGVGYTYRRVLVHLHLTAEK